MTNHIEALKEINTENDSKSEEVFPELRPNQIKTLVAMMTSKTDREAIEKSPYGERYFYKIKPVLMKYKNWYLEKQREEAVTILHKNMVNAAEELAKELEDDSSQIRNKAANDILDRGGLSKPKGTAVKVDKSSDGTHTIQVVSYDGN